MNKDQPQTKPKPGRPRLPPELRKHPRTINMTHQEHKIIRAYLTELRAKPTDNQGETK